MELAKNNFGVEYLIEDSTLESVGVDSKLFNLESAETNFDLESTQEDSIPKSQNGKFHNRCNHDRLCFHPNQHQKDRSLFVLSK